MNWGRPGPLVFNIVVSYCCKRKMLKRNWNCRNNTLFFTFLSLAKFRLGRGPEPLPPPGYANAAIEKNKKGVRKFSARFLVFSNKISTVKKIVLSSSRGQSNFRGPKASRPRPRTGGFEAKAKDLKMCPRGQGRPRGLHLCSFSPIPARKSAETFTKVWKECWWQLRIFKHKSYGETALKPARGSEGALWATQRGTEFLAFSRIKCIV